MARKRRLTARRMADRRFRRTEKLILEAFSKGSGSPSSGNGRVGFRASNFSVEKMMKKIGRSRATFYLHHGGVLEIAGDFEEYILGEYRREIRRFKGSSAREVVYRGLVFVIRNREIFWMLVKRGEGKIFEGMVEEMLRGFQGVLSEAVLVILKGEIVAVFREWGRAGFPEGKMKKAAGDAAWMIETAKKRLGEVE